LSAWRGESIGGDGVDPNTREGGKLLGQAWGKEVQGVEILIVSEISFGWVLFGEGEVMEKESGWLKRR
jgi:hypothetical protein